MARRPRQYLTPNQVAELFMVSPVTLRQWAQRGLLEAHTTPGGHRRYRLDVVREFARRRGVEDVLETNLGGALEEEDAEGVPEGEVDDRKRVLVVDDDRQLNGLLVEMLPQYDDRVIVESAYDGFEAGRKVQSFRPHIVLLDIMMPRVDGFEVCRQLKSDPATMHIRVVAMTGYYSPETSRRIMAAGADYLLRKPFPNEEVLRACGLLGESPRDTRSRHG